jgi:hypothetical protein
MSENKESKTFDTVDHIAVAVSDVKGTVAWHLENFKCQVTYQDDSWALLEFANIRVAFCAAATAPAPFCIAAGPCALW